MDEQVKQFAEWMKEYGDVVFFGGAGVSTESKIPDFRSVDGLYNQSYSVPPETILSATYFYAHTDEFYRFYRDKMIFKDAEPNPAHTSLARLEQMGIVKAVITQNIDGLHQKAGSKEVLELHGSVHRNYCMKCRAFYGLNAIINSTGVPKCEKCGGTIKPDVVLYEEGLDSYILDRSVSHIRRAKVLVIGGTSLAVYPAAGLINYFRGSKVVLINRDATSRDSIADLIIRRPIGQVMKEALEIIEAQA
ncbi:MAG: NAD-dependent protein deacylase [Lachnospiraceae bacterium]|nr:NAD-dependent protein deacylase [Lachnospiraceae bacterium]